MTKENLGDSIFAPAFYMDADGGGVGSGVSLFSFAGSKSQENENLYPGNLSSELLVSAAAGPVGAGAQFEEEYEDPGLFGAAFVDGSKLPDRVLEEPSVLDVAKKKFSPVRWWKEAVAPRIKGLYQRRGIKQSAPEAEVGAVLEEHTKAQIEKSKLSEKQQLWLKRLGKAGALAAGAGLSYGLGVAGVDTTTRRVIAVGVTALWAGGLVWSGSRALESAEKLKEGSKTKAFLKKAGTILLLKSNDWKDYVGAFVYGYGLEIGREALAPGFGRLIDEVSDKFFGGGEEHMGMAGETVAGITEPEGNEASGVLEPTATQEPTHTPIHTPDHNLIPTVEASETPTVTATDVSPTETPVSTETPEIIPEPSPSPSPTSPIPETLPVTDDGAGGGAEIAGGEGAVGEISVEEVSPVDGSGAGGVEVVPADEVVEAPVVEAAPPAEEFTPEIRPVGHHDLSPQGYVEGHQSLHIVVHPGDTEYVFQPYATASDLAQTLGEQRGGSMLENLADLFKANEGYLTSNANPNKDLAVQVQNAFNEAGGNPDLSTKIGDSTLGQLLMRSMNFFRAGQVINLP